jgi:uncharacterized protein (TIGR00251 family)
VIVTWCRDDPEGALLDVLVQPRASREQVGPLHGDRLKIAVQAPPVEGAANESVIRLLARLLGLRRSDVTIRAGQSGRRKTVHVQGLDAETLRKKVLP